MVVLCLCCFPHPSPMLWGTVQWVPPELRNDSYLCERRSSEEICIWYTVFLVTEEMTMSWNAYLLIFFFFFLLIKVLC